ncbi:hypothetical protein ABZ584_13020 [Streptomyces antibioticus]|uniref:hypothetical protein n=1 Tax=Streptomyces antibioticus TaxID=1890 RepID=UPI0033C526FE
MKDETVPPEASAAVGVECGEDVALQLISDRRGSAVWKATGPRRSVAVKVGTGPEGTVITAREAAALHAMGRGGTLANGRGRHRAWMVTPWYDGPSTWEILAGVRAGGGDRAMARRHVAAVCDAVAELHTAGWVHGDLQPGHAIHTPLGVTLIDCSWAWHPSSLLPSHLFRGGMPHLLAPELAAAVEAGALPVTTSRSAEVYTLAASLWWAITGDWPLDYEAVHLDPTGVKAGELREVIGSGRLPLRPPLAWPAVLGVLADALSPDPGRRPTAEALSVLLRR